MSNSLREQMLKSGLASEEDVKRVESQKKGRKKGPKKKKSQRQAPKSDAASHAELYDQAKRARDRDLNREREAERRRQADEKAARKMVLDSEIRRSERDADVAFHFTHGERIKRLYVTGAQQTQLARGELAIARTRGHYRLIPAEVADRVEPVAPFLIAFRGGPVEGEDDPAYEEHPIPDDLMW
ncbi:DUF2058 domain-containing protein [Arhodomonas aquaeolei]|uniref:DUF2058 domain-containing protein n=1 Tax=Arhodomonas aquaeolei TaxID=2369 RepID=UPI0021680482|nr:DUF2058 domain-containing protein [Arhodomonas aquaeolei]MCS4503559.1 DUF2058 domain-containing protein [Arhodomonas aquaeolei]